MNDRKDPPFPIAMNKVEEPAFTKYTFLLAFTFAVFYVDIVMVQGAIGPLAHPPTPEFHFLLVFARKSNYGEGYIEKVVIQKCQ